jgi:protein-S-isoprenylcysteine O-methyltransferase Ste14
MHAVDLVILVCWVAFWIYWFASAVRAKAGRTRLGRFAGFRIAIALVILLLVRAGAFRGHVTTNSPWLQGIGLAIFLGGLALAIWARRYLGRNWGSPMSEKVDPELVTSGPYRSIRHPIYTGLILALVGTSLAISLYWLVIAALAAAYFIYSAFMEERYMTARFPDSYPRYKASSKMLIPYIF